MRWHSERLYFSGDDWFEDLITAVRTATKSVIVSVYIYEADAWGERLAEALCEASRRGLNVRVIVDGVGSPDFERKFAPLLDGCVEWMYYHPFPWQRLPRFLQSRALWYRLLGFWGRFNRRNHCKFFIVDDRIAFSGSINIAAKHSERLYGPGCWRDIGIRVEGEGVKELVESFDWLWHREEAVQPHNHPQVFLNHTRRLRRQLNHAYLRWVRNARKEITLVTPYFVPPPRLMRALLRAAKRGVAVRLITTRKTDVKITRMLARSHYQGLLKRGASIFEYTQGVLHAKASIIDGHHFVGSTNFNHRSFMHDLEVAFLIDAPEARAHMREGLDRFIECSRQVTLADMKRVPLLERLFAKVFFFLRYMS